MKDEEMAEQKAEEYVMREDTITENDRVPFDNGYGFQTVSFEKEVKKGYKDGFLAGLKAGRPQWHDLRKSPNDLPKEGIEVLNDDGVKVVRINGHWRYVYGDEWEDDAHLYHWCEIPTFDKE